MHGEFVTLSQRCQVVIDHLGQKKYGALGEQEAVL